jgi:hypothetical protein
MRSLKICKFACLHSGCCAGHDNEQLWSLKAQSLGLFYCLQPIVSLFFSADTTFPPNGGIKSRSNILHDLAHQLNRPLQVLQLTYKGSILKLQRFFVQIEEVQVVSPSRIF